MRLVLLVSGPPAAGKTTLARALAKRLDLPLISKDDLKETIFDAMGGPAGDLAWSRRIGAAAMEVLWLVAAQCPEVILEANFRPGSAIEQEHLRRLDARFVEVRCRCSDAEIIRRYAERARTAHPAHALTTLAASSLDEYRQPVGIGPLVEVDTSGPVDLDDLTTRLTALLGRPSFAR
ncbi:AAA family ATPase [Fodinicola acaciae]|uniref:AAA family ATPase n=1 Tax=Fodinicola acaciae TaxID=2681555 RepID=UPI0013D3B108|nr:AAA family ATPase [Fodinicola acaciae]